MPDVDYAALAKQAGAVNSTPPPNVGLLAAGNIDLSNRPRVKNPDRSISTVRSMSFGENGHEVLIPTVVGNRVVSDDEAIREYRRTGQHLGIFDNPQHATTYAQQLHEDFAAGKFDKPGARPSGQPDYTALAKAAGAISSAPAAAPLLQYRGLLSSVIPPERQQQIMSTIAGSPQGPLTPTALPVMNARGEFGRTIINTIAPGAEQAVRAIPDIVRGLVNDPIATLRGGAAGMAEGAMGLATPVNAALSVFPILRRLIGRAAPAAVADVTAAGRVAETPVTRGTAGASAADAVAAARKLRTYATEPTAGEVFAGGKAPSVLESEIPLPSKLSKVAVTASAAKVEDLLTAGKHEEAATAIEKHAQNLLDDFRATTSKRLRSSIPGARNLTTNDIAHVEQSIPLEGGLHPRVTAIRPTQEAFNTVEAGRAARTAGYRSDAMAGSRLQNILDSEKGALSNPKLLTTATGAAAGGLLGATGDPEHRTRDIALGTALGAVGGMWLPGVVSAFKTSGIKAGAGKVVYDALLSAPPTTLKIWSSAIGGAVNLAAEKTLAGSAALAMGRGAEGQGLLRQGREILRNVFAKETAQRFVSAFSDVNATSRALEQRPARETTELLGRSLNAMGNAVIPALRAAGVDSEEAARAMLHLANPTTNFGKAALDFWGKQFGARLASGQIFARIGVSTAERFLERTPLGLVKSTNLGTAPSRLEQVVRSAVTGPASIAAGYAAASHLDPVTRRLLTNAGGAYMPGIEASTRAAEAGEAGRSPYQQTVEGAKNIVRGLPGMADVNLSAEPGNIAAMAIPRVLAQVARLRDPYDRKTGAVGAGFGRVQAMIPGHGIGPIPGREDLPVRGSRVNIAGEPVDPRSSLSKILAPSSPYAAPMKGIPENVASELKRLNLDVKPPAFSQKITIGKRELRIPPDVAMEYQQQQRVLLVPRLQSIIESAKYQKLADDLQRAAMLKRVIKKADEDSGHRARAALKKLTRDASSGVTITRKK